MARSRFPYSFYPYKHWTAKVGSSVRSAGQPPVSTINRERPSAASLVRQAKQNGIRSAFERNPNAIGLPAFQRFPAPLAVHRAPTAQFFGFGLSTLERINRDNYDLRYGEVNP